MPCRSCPPSARWRMALATRRDQCSLVVQSTPKLTPAATPPCAAVRVSLISSPQMRRRAFLWFPPIVYMSVIYYLSSQPDPLPELTRHVWDKLLHTIEYAGLGFLVFRALAGEGVNKTSAALLTLAVVSGYGATDEWHQSFVPMRNADVRDWLVDTLGALIGPAVYVST